MDVIEILKRERDIARKYIDTAGVILIAIDADQKVSMINRKGCAFLGYSEEEILGKNWFDHFLPDRMKGQTRGIFAKLMAGEMEPPEYGEGMVLTRSGAERIIVWQDRILKDDRDNIMGTLGSGEDITERKRAEEKLARESSLNATLAELSRALIESATLEKISSLVLERARSLTNSPSGFVGYIDPPTGYLIVPTMTKEIRNICQVPDTDIVFKEFKGLWGWVLANRQPLFTNTPADDPRSSGVPESHVPIYRFLSAPAMIGNTVLGQVSLANADRDYSEMDLGAVERLAALYALAIQRHWTEQALRDSEERYRAVMKQSPDGVYLIDAGTKKVLEANAAFARMLGYADEETRELTSYDIVAADRKDVEQRFQEILASGEPLSFERELRRKDGSSVRVWANVSVISYGGRRVLAVMVRDMTDREKAEQALRGSEARFRAIMEQSPEGICLVAMETKCILQANEAFQRMLGYSAEEITGLSVYDFVSADREIIDRRFQETVTEGKPLSDERQYRRKDGSPIDVWVSRNIISYGGKKVMCVVVVDLTERKRTERALHDSETRYRTLMEQSPNSIFLVDMDTKGVLEANTAFHKLLGYTSEEILRLSIYDFIATERKDIRRRFQEILDAGHPMSYERQFRHKDGSLMDVWLSATVISFAGTNLALGVAIDITDRKRAETEREKLIRELQEALTNVKTLRGLLPICASCKKIRDDKGYWNQIESYVREHSEAQFTHGLCPECARRFLEDTASRKPPNHPELPSS